MRQTHIQESSFPVYFSGEIILVLKKKNLKGSSCSSFLWLFLALIIWKLAAHTVHPLWIQYFPADGKLCDIQILYKDLIVHSDLRCQKNQSGNSANSFILLKILSQWMARYPQCDILQPRPLLLAPTATTWQTSTSAPSFCSSSSQIICLHESRSLGPLTSTSWKRKFPNLPTSYWNGEGPKWAATCVDGSVYTTVHTYNKRYAAGSAQEKLFYGTTQFWRIS